MESPTDDYAVLRKRVSDEYMERVASLRTQTFWKGKKQYTISLCIKYINMSTL